MDSEERDLEEIRKEISKLRQQAETNFYKEMRWLWVKIILVLLSISLASVFIGILLGHFLPVFPHMENPSRDEQITSDLFIATITINGVITGFVPIISFFFNSEVKEDYREIEQELEQQRKVNRDKKQELIGTEKTLYFMILHNLRSGVLKYTQLFIMVSVLLQFILVGLYLFTVTNTMVILYQIVDIPILMIIILGILPIINLALNKPALRFVEVIVKPAETVTRIEPEE